MRPGLAPCARAAHAIPRLLLPLRIVCDKVGLAALLLVLLLPRARVPALPAPRRAAALRCPLGCDRDRGGRRRRGGGRLFGRLFLHSALVDLVAQRLQRLHRLAHLRGGGLLLMLECGKLGLAGGLGIAEHLRQRQAHLEEPELLLQRRQRHRRRCRRANA